MAQRDSVGPICMSCIYLDEDDQSFPGKCSAFEGGIPKKIWENEQDHRVEIKGDDGIVFEQDPGKLPVDWSLYQELFEENTDA